MPYNHVLDLSIQKIYFGGLLYLLKQLAKLRHLTGHASESGMQWTASMNLLRDYEIKNMKKRLYIGVIGRWHGEDSHILALCSSIGEEIEKRGHILVTG